MKRFHVICGLPRSGSTLLQNLLNQRSDVFASSTSALAPTVRALSGLWSQSMEVRSDLINAKEETEERLAGVTREVIRRWYHDRDEIVFDKSRHWNNTALLLHHLVPEAQMLVCVRDLRNVFASTEIQHEKNPILDESPPTDRTVMRRADRAFSPGGFIGQHVLGVEDLLRRGLPYAHFVQFERLVRDPVRVLDEVAGNLGIERFEYDVENIQSTATDVDGLYLYKYPHEGSGEVRDPGDYWRRAVPSDIASLIMGKFPYYNQQFGYR